MRILLAEDERDLSRALSAILSKNNYSVDAVYNGEDAISYIESGVYDCVILDVMMPKIDGITVLKNIRSKNINIPIIILTAKTEIEELKTQVSKEIKNAKNNTFDDISIIITFISSMLFYKKDLKRALKFIKAN